MLCPACGTWSTQADRCSHCGAALAAPPPAPVPAGGSAPQPPASPAPAYGQPAPGQGPYAQNPYAAANPYAPPAQPMPQQMPPPYAAPYGPYAGQPQYGGQAAPGGFPAPAAYPGAPGVVAGYGWQPPRPFQPLRGLATSLYVLLGLSAVGAAVSIVAYIMRALLLNDLIDDPDSVSGGDADNADNFVTAAAGFTGVVLLATMVVFCIWFYRARCNVDLFGPSRQRLAKGWAIGGWFCPVVWWWFPKLIAHDIWKASDAQAAERGGATPGRKPVLWVWWVLFVLAAWSPAATAFLYPAEDDIVAEDAKDLRLADYVSSGTQVLLVFAAIAAVFVVRRITALQHAREAQAFAAVGGPQEVPGAPVWSGAPMPGPVAVDSGVPAAAQPASAPMPAPAPAPAPAGPPPMPAMAPTVPPVTPAVPEPAPAAEGAYPEATAQLAAPAAPAAAAPSLVKDDVVPAPAPAPAPPAADEAESAAPPVPLVKQDAAEDRPQAPAPAAAAPQAEGTTAVTPAVAEPVEDAVPPAVAPGAETEVVSALPEPSAAEAGTTVVPAVPPTSGDNDAGERTDDTSVPAPRPEAGTVVLPIGGDEPAPREDGDDAPRS